MAEGAEHLVDLPEDNPGGVAPPVDQAPGNVNPPGVVEGEHVEGGAQDGAHAVQPEDQGGGQALADPPAGTEGGTNATGTKERTTSIHAKQIGFQQGIQPSG